MKKIVIPVTIAKTMLSIRTNAAEMKKLAATLDTWLCTKGKKPIPKYILSGNDIILAHSVTNKRLWKVVVKWLDNNRIDYEYGDALSRALIALDEGSDTLSEIEKIIQTKLGGLNG